MQFRSMTLGAGLAVALMIPTAPVSATHAPASASVDRREVLAGSANVGFRFYVAHPASQTPVPAINYVRVVAPQAGLIPEERLVTAVSGEASGWNARLPDSGSVEFSGGQLAAGQAAYFTVIGNVPRRSADTCGDWWVLVSSDGGATLQQATQSYSGGLATCARVLEVQSLSLVAPAGAVDNSVTEGQTGVCGRMRIFNAGSDELSVTSTADGSRITVGAIRDAADPPCSGAPLPDGRVSIAPGGTAFAEFELSFGAAGNTYLYGRASAPGATAMQANLYISIQPRPMLGVSKVEPKSVRPGAGVSLSVEVAKGPANSPGIDLAGTTLTWAGCPPRQIEPPTRFPDVFIPEQPPVKRFFFQPCNVAQIPDGRYDALVRLQTVDDNGMVFSTDVIAGKIRVDSVPPHMSVSLTPPPPDCCVPPERPAVRNGDALGIKVEVVDQDPDTGLWEPCPDCLNVTSLLLRQFAGNGSELPPIVLPPGATSYAGAYHSLAAMILAQVTGSDAYGLEITAFSPPLDVDNVAPRMAAARVTTVSGGARRMLNVTFTECVAGTIGPVAELEWVVTDQTGRNPVVDVAMAAGSCQVQLTVLRDIPPTPQGTLSFQPLPAPLPASRLFDRVGNVMPQHSVALSEGT